MSVKLVGSGFIRRATSSHEAASRLLRGVERVESYPCVCGCFGRSVRLWRLIFTHHSHCTRSRSNAR